MSYKSKRSRIRGRSRRSKSKRGKTKRRRSIFGGAVPLILL